MVAACFYGKCTVCSTTYYHSFYETKEGEQHFYEVSSTSKYLQCTAETVFELELLKQLTMQLTVSACTFESQAAVYNAVHGASDHVRLQEFASNFRRSNAKQHPDGNDW